MAIPKQYEEDLRAILGKRHDNGADFWATPDGRWGKGSPYSTFDSVLMLHELGMQRTDPILKGAAKQILNAWQEDGCFRPAPKRPPFIRATRPMQRGSFVDWATHATHG